ncbi:MAG: hypothetical protein JNM84_14455 [Planctomycetes bacterium]|nr:hypothetical protein [Planctomycetota bacterium]
MNTSAFSLGSSLLAALALATTAGAQAVQVGDQPSFSFRSTPLQGQGVKSLQDLQGKPVLVEFWGTR